VAELEPAGRSLRRVVDVIDVDRGALGGEAEGDRAADPAAPARYESDLVRKSHRVTAPRAADETLRAYFASTPLRARGSGAGPSYLTTTTSPGCTTPS